MVKNRLRCLFKIFCVLSLVLLIPFHTFAREGGVLTGDAGVARTPQVVPKPAPTVDAPSKTSAQPDETMKSNLAVDVSAAENANDQAANEQPDKPDIEAVNSASSKTPADLTKVATVTPAADEPKDIFLNFENTNLSNFVNYMAEQKKINLLPDKTLDQVKVSLSIRDPLSLSGAWNVFLTVLEMAGFSIVCPEGSDLYKVLPKDKKLTEALPSYINVAAEALPDSDLTVRYVFFLQNLQIDSVRDLFESMLSDKHQLYPYKEVNGFIVTDRCYNIKSAVKVLQELDRMGQPETVVVMHLKRTNADDIKQLLDALIKKPDGNPLARLLGKTTEGTTDYFPPGTKIVSEPRTNSLILMGSPGPIKKIEDFIINHLDTELRATASPLHIYELQYTDASQIKDILESVTQAPDGGPGQQASKYGAIRGGVKYFKSMKFQVDKDGNRLIVSSTDKQDWKMLKQTIKDLDKPQPQVAVETLFVSITASDLDNLGGAIRNKKHGQIGKGIDFQAATQGSAVQTENNSSGNPISLLGNLLFDLIPKQGTALLSFGQPTNVWAVFQMLKERTNASVLSQPFLTLANKTIGKITVGQTIRIVDSTSGAQTGYTDASANTVLELEPQINLDGIIRMRVNAQIKDFLDASSGTGNTQNKNVTTNVTMADGQVLVLGGFIQTTTSDAVQKTPILGDIPILGWFFKGQQRRVDRTYVFIFMAPTIIKPRTLPGVELYTKMKLHQATEDIERGVKTSKSPDPLFNWFFDPKKENYSHKVVDFASARYQPTTVDIKNDPYYRSSTSDDDTIAPVSDVQPVPVEPAKQPIKLPATPTIGEPSSVAQVKEKSAEQAKTNIAIPITPTLTTQPSNSPLTKQQDIPRATTPEASEPPSESQQRVLDAIAQRSQERSKINKQSTPSVDEQRQKLKALMSQAFAPAPAATQAPRAQEVTTGSDLDSKRATLKQSIEAEAAPSAAPTAAAMPHDTELHVDAAKRNSLKEFLSQADIPEPMTRNTAS